MRVVFTLVLASRLAMPTLGVAAQKYLLPTLCLRAVSTLEATL